MTADNLQPKPVQAPSKQRVWPLILIIFILVLCIAGLALYATFGPQGFIDQSDADNRRAERQSARMKEVSGRYVNPANQGYITLNADGSLDYNCPELSPSRSVQAGFKWEMNNENQMFIQTAKSGGGYRLLVSGNTINKGGDQWVKQ